MSLGLKINIAIALTLELYRAWRRSRLQTSRQGAHAEPHPRS